MSNDPFQGLATQAYNDTQRLSQTIDTFLAATPQPNASNLNAIAAKPKTQTQSPTTSNTAQTETAAQKALSQSPTASTADQREVAPQPSKALMFGVGALLVGGIVLLGSFLKNDAKE